MIFAAEVIFSIVHDAVYCISTAQNEKLEKIACNLPILSKAFNSETVLWTWLVFRALRVGLHANEVVQLARFARIPLVSHSLTLDSTLQLLCGARGV